MRNKRLLSLLLLSVILLTACTQQAFSEQDFETISSENFVVYFVPRDKNAARDVLRVLEESHDRIVEDLKPDTTGIFTVRIYPNLGEFHKAINKPDAPSWVVGTAQGDSRFAIVSPRNPGPAHRYQGILQVAVHELTHCISLRLISGTGVNGRRMLWLFEGIALYQADQFRDPKAFPYMLSGDYPPFLELGNNEIYNVGYTVVEYIVDRWGMDSVRHLLLTEGNVTSVLGVTEDEFYEGWYAFVKEKYLD